MRPHRGCSALRLSGLRLLDGLRTVVLRLRPAVCGTLLGRRVDLVELGESDVQSGRPRATLRLVEGLAVTLGADFASSDCKQHHLEAGAQTGARVRACIDVLVKAMRRVQIEHLLRPDLLDAEKWRA